MAGVAAGALGFLIFNHAFDGLDLYGALSFFEIFIAGQSSFHLRTLLQMLPLFPDPQSASRYSRDHLYLDNA
jgi:hypothetical protein